MAEERVQRRLAAILAAARSWTTYQASRRDVVKLPFDRFWRTINCAGALQVGNLCEGGM